MATGSRSSSSPEGGAPFPWRRLRPFALGASWAFIFVHSLLWYVFSIQPFGKMAMVGVLYLGFGVLNAASVMILLILASLLVFGRGFCGWACHMRGIIELSDSLLRRFARGRPRVLSIPHHFSLRLCSLFVLLSPLLIQWGRHEVPGSVQGVIPPLAGLPGSAPDGRLFHFSAPWNPSLPPGLAGAAMIVGAVLFLLLSMSLLLSWFYGPGAFCRLLCPYSVLFMPFLNRNPGQRKITRIAGCTGCLACSRACPQGIDVSRELYRGGGKLGSLECIKCGVCIDVCDHGVLEDSARAPAPQPKEPPWPAAAKPLYPVESFSIGFELLTLLGCLVCGIWFSQFGAFFFFAGCVYGLLLFRRVLPSLGRRMLPRR